MTYGLREHFAGWILFLQPTERRLVRMPNSSRLHPASRGQIEVLVVQSNPADTILTVEAFHAAGLTTGLNCVMEGEDALSYVRGEGKYANVPTPDLIFLDLSQPRVSGLEVLKVIKSTPALKHIPIVVAAGSDDPKFVRAVYELNGNCFIRKPGELDEFVRFIESCYEFWSKVVTLSPQPQAVKYRVREPLLAVLNEPGTPTVLLTIGRGSVITVKAKVQQSGFVDVSYEGQLVNVFMRDIEKSADRVEGQA
jgi:chemotaxis family two-component system response regulator Rcp1